MIGSLADCWLTLGCLLGCFLVGSLLAFGWLLAGYWLVLGRLLGPWLAVDSVLLGSWSALGWLRLLAGS